MHFLYGTHPSLFQRMALNRSLIFAVYIEAFLLQAEEQFSQMDFEAAGVLYEAAILSSKRHKFLNEEALANELAGYFYLDTGKKMKSIHYFSQAFQKYTEWGALAKASTLSKYLN